jgi:hypothetical protein
MSQLGLTPITSVKQQIKRTCYYDHAIDHKDMTVRMTALVYTGDDISFFSASYTGMEVSPVEMTRFLDMVFTIDPCVTLFADHRFQTTFNAFQEMLIKHDVELAKPQPYHYRAKGQIEMALKELSDLHKCLNINKSRRKT